MTAHTDDIGQTIREFDDETCPHLNILHFNDVYNIEPTEDENCGGAARFQTVIQELKTKYNPLIVFSGDIFSPSPISTITKGEQMVEILSHIGVDYACLGNHDFDFGMKRLGELVNKTKVTWLLTNLLDYTSKDPLGGACSRTVVVHDGMKVGLMGLVEEEWINTLGTIDKDEVIYEDFVEKGEAVAKELKEQGADIIIALTHMREYNDMKLLKSCPSIDVILGGHDHTECFYMENRKIMLKSGTDFRELTLFQVGRSDVGFLYNVTRYWINKTVPETPVIKDIVEKYAQQLKESMNIIIGEIFVDLDGRFERIRTSETNLGNFISDCVLMTLNADCCLLNSGSFRSDRIHKAGPFTLGTLRQIIPMEDLLLVLRCTGQVIKDALENAVSKWPALEGRFLQVSGVCFAFDPSQPSGSRIDAKNVIIQDAEIDLNATYLVALKEYMWAGKDGYSMFRDCEVVVDTENGPTLANTVANFFTAVMQRQAKLTSMHRLSLIPLTRQNSLLITLDENRKKAITFKGVSTAIAKSINLHKFVRENLQKRGGIAEIELKNKERNRFIKRTSTFQRQLSEWEKEVLKLCPKIEGRITQISNSEDRQ